MKKPWLALLTLICGMLWINGCSEPAHVEDRVIVLPPNNPRTSRATAVQVEKKLIAKGMGAEIGRQFPSMNAEKLGKLYLASGEGIIQGNKRVFIRTGLRYTDTFPEAKAVADYAQTLVRRQIIMALITPTHVGKITNGATALVLEYPTTIPIENMPELRAEMDWIWEAFVLDVEHAGLTNGVIRATHANGPGGLLVASRSATLLYEKRSDGKWYSLQAQKK